ncbi:proton channel OTOP2-like [Denticeps clupeoides]|uniref:proton channel OTOP2-like n=1 Tax=Denticeps clupeoides TaxID=299321 RepID=UPI0010A41000|nr:proton channel OTOP2-like [Denticeps clupeoides]
MHTSPDADVETGGGFATEHTDPEPALAWVPGGRRLLSGLLGLNAVLLGAALVAGDAFHPDGLRHQEPLVYVLTLMALGVAWMVWYLFWARKLPGLSPHTDHHAGGITVTVVLIIFAGFSLLLHAFKIAYYMIMRECYPVAKVLFPLFEAPFLALQTYLLWAHSKDCIHKHKILTRAGLMVILSANLLLWLNTVTEDTIHMQIEIEKGVVGTQDNDTQPEDTESPEAEPTNSTLCQCGEYTACLLFRKGYEVLYPFNIEYYLMAGCMLYIMWKNVGRHIEPGSHQSESHPTKMILRYICNTRIYFGPLFGFLILGVGITIFILYQVWVSQWENREIAFNLFYGYHLAVVPIMTLCSLAGVLLYKLERRALKGGNNPTRSLDVLLLVGAALGQLSLSYFSLVAALAVGTSDKLASLDLSYSLLSLVELVFQNIFIIEGLHRHPSLARGKRRDWNVIFKKKKIKEDTVETEDTKVMERAGGHSLLDKIPPTPSPTGGPKAQDKQQWIQKAIKEICCILILSNVMLWVIPAFGVHPQFENGIGKQFFGFTAWFVLVNLGQPLGVFYRMHSVSALMELLIST